MRPLLAARRLEFDDYVMAAGEVLTAKQAPHRPGPAPALGLRAEGVAAIPPQTVFKKECDRCDFPLSATF